MDPADAAGPINSAPRGRPGPACARQARWATLHCPTSRKTAGPVCRIRGAWGSTGYAQALTRTVPVPFPSGGETIPGYAAALLSSIAHFRGTPDDVSDAVAARMRRNEVLGNGARRFSFVLEESVLRYRLCGAETMAAQLGHLLGVMDLQNVAVGLIPFSAQRAV